MRSGWNDLSSRDRAGSEPERCSSLAGWLLVERTCVESCLQAADGRCLAVFSLLAVHRVFESQFVSELTGLASAHKGVLLALYVNS